MDDVVLSDASFADSRSPADDPVPEHQGRGGLAAALAAGGLIVPTFAVVLMLEDAPDQIATVFLLDAALILIAGVLALADGDRAWYRVGALLLWATFGLTVALMLVAIFSIGLAMGIP